MGGQDALPSTQDAAPAPPVMGPPANADEAVRAPIEAPALCESRRPEFVEFERHRFASPSSAILAQAVGHPAKPRYRLLRRLVKGSRFIRILLLIGGVWLLKLWVFGG